MKHCQHCNKDFATPSSLKRHIIAKHADETSAVIRHVHRCPSCNINFARNETLQRHIGSKHTRELMKTCQFCQENFRDDYFFDHESTCARRYWAKFCRNASLIKRVRNDQSDEINRRPWELSIDVRPVPATENGLRVVHEINIDLRLASKAFTSTYMHFLGNGSFDSCLEAITISFRHGVLIDPWCQDEPPPQCRSFHDVNWLALNVGCYVRGYRNINDPDPRGYTLMDSACSAGAASLLEPLFWRGAEFGNKSLLYAIKSGSFDTVHFCLALGADPDGFAMRRGYMYGGSPLMEALANPETTHIASLLVGYGAIVFVRDALGNTPLHFAAHRADADLLRVLLAKDSSLEFLNALDDDGERAIHVAILSIPAEDQVLEFVSALLDAGADTNGFGYQISALRRAVRVDSSGAIVRLLLNREPESPQKNKYLNEALMEAFYENAMGILIEAGATVDDDILEYALKHKHSRSVELLLKAGARLHLVEHLTLECLFHAARDQQLTRGWCRGLGGREWDDAEAKYELLRLHFPDDARLRDLRSETAAEDIGT
jgi:ankyrin repeat protein